MSNASRVSSLEERRLVRVLVSAEIALGLQALEKKLDATETLDLWDLIARYCDSLKFRLPNPETARGILLKPAPSHLAEHREAALGAFLDYLRARLTRARFDEVLATFKQLDVGDVAGLAAKWRHPYTLRRFTDAELAELRALVAARAARGDVSPPEEEQRLDELYAVAGSRTLAQAEAMIDEEHRQVREKVLAATLSVVNENPPSRRDYAPKPALSDGTADDESQ